MANGQSGDLAYQPAAQQGRGSGNQPQGDPDLGGQTADQFLADRSGETPAVQPPSEPGEQTWGEMARGYGGAAVKGVVGASPVLAVEAAIPGPGWAAIPGTALSAAAGGVAEHFVEQQFPNAPGWIAPAAGAVPALWGGGVPSLLGLGSRAAGPFLRHPGQTIIGAGLAAHEAAGAVRDAGSYFANHIYQTGMAVIGAPLTLGIKRMAQNPRQLFYPAIGAIGGTAEGLGTDVENYLNPPQQQPPPY